MSKILLLTTEPLPLAGWPTTGAGLRAWSLGLALRGRGHDVTLLMPDDAAAGFKPAEGTAPPTREFPAWVETFSRRNLAGDARLRECDAIVLQHWGMARDLPELSVPLAIDLAGPHLLERRLWGSTSPEADLAEKLDALRRADFITASGHRQRLYFIPFLQMAGWETGGLDDLAPVIPYSLVPDPTPAPARADRFIYGGFFLPWQDPTEAVEAVLTELDAAGRGELLFIGGAHPHADVSGGRFEPLLKKLQAHPRVKLIGPRSYDAYLALLREGGIALDLMARNAEREIAFTTRTVQYMACGLPVIHDNYSELGEMIERTGAGWTFDPGETDRLRALVRGILRDEVDVLGSRRAALALVQEELNADLTIEPLDRFCRAPCERAGKLRERLAFEERAVRSGKLEAELRETRSALDTLMGKRWVRWGLSLFSGRALLALPVAALATLIGLAMIPVFWISDLMRDR